jgi:hypothetical protein
MDGEGEHIKTQNMNSTRIITKDTIPNTLEEAIQVLDAMLCDEDKEYLRTEENAAILVHDSLGRWIRNNWSLWGDYSPLKKQFIDRGITHPDEMSHNIIESYISYLNLEE